MKEPKLIFDKEKVVAFLKTDADGHSIFDPELFTKELGFEKEKLKSLVKTHQSDPESYKETIVKDGERVEETQGIYCLDFLYWFAKKLGLSTENSFSGRGFQARFLTINILSHLQNQ